MKWGTPAAVTAAAVVLAVLGNGCAERKKVASAPPPVPVTAASAVQRDVPLSVRAIGTVESYNTVSIRSRVNGELVKVSFTEGQNVRKGDLLFTIDPRPYQAALQSAQADSARDAAKAASADADAKRYGGLVEKEYITQQQYDQAMSNALAARATVESDVAALRNARISLGYCFIRSPITGRTGNLLVHEGNLVNANGDPLVTIQQLEPIYVRFSVPSDQLPEIRSRAAQEALRAQATISGDSTRTYTGELTFIDNAVDVSTGTVLLKASFPNQDQALWPGEFVTLNLIVSTIHDAVVIPAQAIQNSQNGTFAYVIKSDMTATMQPVQLGPRIQDSVVVENGVLPQQLVVTDGQLRLVPGAKVQIKTGLMPSGGGASGSGAPAAAPAGRGAPGTGGTSLLQPGKGPPLPGSGEGSGTQQPSGGSNGR